MPPDHLPFWPDAFGDPIKLIGFLVCVAIAAYAQTLTGFAFGLILLSSVALLDLVPITDAANAAMVLTLVNTCSFFRADRRPPPWRLMRPALLAASVSVMLGLVLLMWLSSQATHWLKIVLGVVITGCALLLMVQSKPRDTVSSPLAFGVAGGFAGLLGGLFGSSGMPIVYLLYRQPLDLLLVRRALLLMFATSSGLRLIFVLISGTFNLRSLLLFALSVPIVHFITTFTAGRPIPVSTRTLRVGVSCLLIVTGALLVFSGWRASTWAPFGLAGVERGIFTPARA